MKICEPANLVELAGIDWIDTGQAGEGALSNSLKTKANSTRSSTHFGWFFYD